MFPSKRIAAVGAVAGLAALGVAAMPSQANAWWRGPGFGISLWVPPVVVAPAPVYAPPPVYHAPPPAYYAPPPAYYGAPPAAYYGGPPQSQRAWVPPHWENGAWVAGHWA